MTRQPEKEDTALPLVCDSPSPAADASDLHKARDPSSGSSQTAKALEAAELEPRKADTVVKGRFKITSLNSPEQALQVSCTTSVNAAELGAATTSLQKVPPCVRGDKPPPKAAPSSQQQRSSTPTRSRPPSKRLPQTVSQQKGRFEISDVAASEVAFPPASATKTPGGGGGGGSPARTAALKGPTAAEQPGGASEEPVIAASKTVQSGRFTISDLTTTTADRSCPDSSASAASSGISAADSSRTSLSGRFEVMDLGLSTMARGARDDGGDGLTQVGPLALMTALQNQMQSLLQQNEELKQENQRLRKENSRLQLASTMKCPSSPTAIDDDSADASSSTVSSHP